MMLMLALRIIMYIVQMLAVFDTWVVTTWSFRLMTRSY